MKKLLLSLNLLFIGTVTCFPSLSETAKNRLATIAAISCRTIAYVNIGKELLNHWDGKGPLPLRHQLIFSPITVASAIGENIALSYTGNNHWLNNAMTYDGLCSAGIAFHTESTLGILSLLKLPSSLLASTGATLIRYLSKKLN